MSSLLSDIISAITGAFTNLGQAVINLIKDGFIWLFTEYTESQGVYTITGVSAFGYFVFILMGQKKGSLLKKFNIANLSNCWEI